MKLKILALVGLLLALPGVAQAKGADKATVKGDGLAAPIRFKGNGEPGSGSKLGRLSDATGIFPSVFETYPDPTSDEAPGGELGPRFTIAWHFPGPAASGSVVKQDVYPYAPGGAMAFVEPGQALWDQEVSGGWFRATDDLLPVLKKEGFPSKAVLALRLDDFAPPPTSAAASTAPAASSSSWPLIGGAAAIAALLAIGAIYLSRRRPSPATAP